MFWNILFPLHRLFYMHSTRKEKYRATHAIPSNRHGKLLPQENNVDRGGAEVDYAFWGVMIYHATP